MAIAEWHRLGKRRDLREVARPACEHDALALPGALVGGHLVALASRAHRTHRGVGPHRGRYRLGVALDEGDGLGHRAEAVGIVALIAVAGQPALPVGREQAQRVPPLRLPRVGHLAALEDHMVDRALREAPAHGQPGMAGPDDNGGGAPRWRASNRHRPGHWTSTVTLVGLVMMS